MNFEEFKQDLFEGNLAKYGLVPNGSHLMPGFENEEIQVLYYGRTLSVITIGEEDIWDIFDMPGAEDPYKELAYYITDEAIKFLMEKLSL